MCKKIFLCIVYFVAVSFTLKSQSKEKSIHSSGVSFAIDEDFFVKRLGLNKDRNYTLGLHFSMFNSNWNSIFSEVLKINKSECTLLPSEFSFDVVAFTPNIISKEEIQYNDRPYSNVLFLSLKRHGVNKVNTEYYSKTFYVGVLGTGVANYFQTGIHRLMGSVEPEGWQNQISDGGEPTILYTRKKMNLFSVNSELFQMYHGYTYNLFYITGITYNLGFRFGKYNKKNWLYDMSGFIGSTSTKTNRKILGKKKNEFYFYCNLNTNLNVYNASLHGQFRETNYRLPYSKTGFLTIDTSLGVAFSLGKTTLSIYHKLRSPEIWDVNYKYWHNWGGVSFVYECGVN